MPQSLIQPDGKDLGQHKESATVIFKQTFASAVWTINHDLGKYPSVTCVESNNEVIYGSIRYPSNVTITVTFTSPCSGNAYLN